MSNYTDPELRVRYMAQDATPVSNMGEALIAPFIGLGLIDEQGHQWRVYDVWQNNGPVRDVELIALVRKVTAMNHYDEGLAPDVAQRYLAEAHKS